ncbi:MAG: hypothetical protein P4L66_04385 [Acetobacteraceae bacterium]|nr:hypothetical protein [Acetobacteraceae bacterium]
MTDMVSAFAPPEFTAQVEAHTLSHEARIASVTRSALTASGAWGEFMRKVLPPIAPQSSARLVRLARA